MKYLPQILLLCLVVSCSARRTVITRVPTEQAELEMAKKLASQIHEGMTFDQVSKIVSLDEDKMIGAAHHGGEWYDVNVGGAYYIQLRFEHAVGGQDQNTRVLNLTPRIKSRESPGAVWDSSEDRNLLK